MTTFATPPPGEQKPADSASSTTTTTNNKPTHNFVTSIYSVPLANLLCNITVTWAKTLISHTLYITVEHNPLDQSDHYTCKIDLKTWQFWGKKGLKTFTVSEKRVDVFWDLRAAKFSASPQPSSDFYVAMVCSGELVLLLGDQKNEALKRTKSRPSLEDAMLVHKKELVFAKKCFCTKTTMGKDRKEHNIIIESSLNGPYDPEMWISVDSMKSIRVPNLHWRFRGNETITVDDFRVQILWDVHDWLYSASRSGVGIFVFRSGPGVDELGGGRNRSGGGDSDIVGSGFWDVNQAAAEETCSVGFCHFLYAWKTE